MSDKIRQRKLLTAALRRRSTLTDLPSYPGTPRWVKISGIIAGIMALTAVIAVFASDGRHGPGRHLSSSGVTEDGAQQ